MDCHDKNLYKTIRSSSLDKGQLGYCHLGLRLISEYFNFYNSIKAL